MNSLTNNWKIYQDWLKTKLPIYYNFNHPATQQDFEKLEKFIKEKLPDDFIELYEINNGDSPHDFLGPFLGFDFLSIDSILTYLKEIKKQQKPLKRFIPENSLQESENIVLSIVNSLRENTSISNWKSIEFELTKGGMSGSIVFDEDDKKHQDLILFKSEEMRQFWRQQVKALYKIEGKTYKWDVLKFYITKNDFILKREDYAWFYEERFSSYPENHIKRRDFNLKWLPIFADYVGNYIGIDLDPDNNGKRGQIINFGRDEYHKFVIADSLSDFMKFIIEELNKGELDKAIVCPDEDENEYDYGLRPNSHLIDDFKKILVK